MKKLASSALENVVHFGLWQQNLYHQTSFGMKLKDAANNWTT